MNRKVGSQQYSKGWSNWKNRKEMGVPARCSRYESPTQIIQQTQTLPFFLVSLWDMRASHGRPLVTVGFSYRSTYMWAYFRGDFIVYKLGYFIVSPHVAFATSVTHLFLLTLFEFSSAILTLSRRYNTYLITEGFRSCKTWRLLYPEPRSET